MNKPEKKIKNTSNQKKTPTPVISGYTSEEMEEIYSFAQSKIGEKPSSDLANEPRMDFRIADRAVQHSDKGNRVKIDPSRDSLLTDFGMETLEDRYLLPGESFQDLFARVASFYGDNEKQIISQVTTLKNITILIIAHRTESLASCDKIIYLENGSLKEIGKYEDIIIKYKIK